jgi:electron-transferring-flavoprotein dehydrogenase
MIISSIARSIVKFQGALIRYACATVAREQVEYDVLIVGGGVAGLSTAIRLKQKEKETGRPISVCLVEKGSEIGDHILSGNCFEPRGFD